MSSVFVSGMLTTGYLVAALFFLRFFVRTRDRLFCLFAVAFGLMALAQALLALTGLPVEDRSWIYLVRLGAFFTILFAIIQKNHRATR